MTEQDKEKRLHHRRFYKAEQEAGVDRGLWHSLERNGKKQTDEAIVRYLLERHFKHTGSTRARNLLDDWSNARKKFVKVFPHEYKRALGEMAAAAKTDVVPA